jgi:hypothetical protein
MKYIAKTLSGKTLVYASRDALNRAKRRPRKDVIVDSWPENDPPPTNSDAQAWDAYRTRRGYAGG